MAATTSLSSHTLRIAERYPNFRVYYICYSHTHILKAWHLARNHYHPTASCVIVGIQIKFNRATFRVPVTRGESRTSEYLPVLTYFPSTPHYIEAGQSSFHIYSQDSTLFRPSFPSRVPKPSWQRSQVGLSRSQLSVALKHEIDEQQYDVSP